MPEAVARAYKKTQHDQQHGPGKDPGGHGIDGFIQQQDDADREDENAGPYIIGAMIMTRMSPVGRAFMPSRAPLFPPRLFIHFFVHFSLIFMQSYPSAGRPATASRLPGYKRR